MSGSRDSLGIVRGGTSSNRFAVGLDPKPEIFISSTPLLSNIASLFIVESSSV